MSASHISVPYPSRMHNPGLLFNSWMILGTSRTWQIDADHASQGTTMRWSFRSSIGVADGGLSGLVAQAMETVGTMTAMIPSPLVEARYADGAPHGRIVGRTLPRWSASMCNRRIWAYEYHTPSNNTLVPSFVLFLLYSDRFVLESGHLAHN